MNQGHIYINGVIGSYTDENGQDIKGVELLDVISQVKNQPDAKSFLVHIGTPGGIVETGNQIYDYLQSLKAQGVNVDTISDSYVNEKGEVKFGIGSIGTKVFLAGVNRSIIEGHEFFIHNPWTQVTGDSNKIALEMQGLKQTETELRTFYQSHTKVTDVGLKGLMDNQTGMTADQAVSLGFATRKVSPTKVKAFAQLKSNKVAIEKPITKESVLALLQKALGIKAALPGAAPDQPDFTGKPVLIDGVAAPDGVYTVVGGLVTAVESVSEETNEPPAGGATAQPGNPNPAAGAAVQPSAEMLTLQNQLKALTDQNAAQAKELADLKAVDVNAIVTKAIDEFKASTPIGRSPTKGVNHNGGAIAQPVYKNMAMRLAELEQSKSKEQIKN